MKKKVTLLTVLLLTLSMLFALCACSSYGSIKKAYENAGYTESESIQEYQDKIVEALGEVRNERRERLCDVDRDELRRWEGVRFDQNAVEAVVEE